MQAAASYCLPFPSAIIALSLSTEFIRGPMLNPQKRCAVRSGMGAAKYFPLFRASKARHSFLVLLLVTTYMSA
jgi:hypothetical protein